MIKYALHALLFMVLLSTLHAQAQDPDLLRPNPDAIAEIESGKYDAASVAGGGFNPEEAPECLKAAIT